MIDENDEKKRCPICKSTQVKLDGLTKQGKQRYQCKRCQKRYTWKTNEDIEQRRFSWFKQWLLEGLTIKQVAKIKKVSHSTVKRVINYWLKKEPLKQRNLESIRHIILDGTYLEHRDGIYAVMDAMNHRIIYGAYGINENAKDLKMVYQKLKQEGLNPLSATIDGSFQQFKYIKQTWDNLIIQRCLVHIQRQGLSWLRMKPKRIDAIKLREILLQVLSIKTKKQSEDFIEVFQHWEDIYGVEIKKQTNRGRVFSDLIRTRSMIINALPFMFSYLDNAEISKTTNALEGYFGRLKENYRRHKGLAKSKRISYFNWYFFLKPI